MNRISTRISIIILLFFPAILFAQENKDYSIKLNSGSFIPVENSKDIQSNSVLLTNSLFNDKFYLTIQFWSLPDEATKDRLKTAGVQLIDYIPGFSFTASVAAGIDPAIFRGFNIRSIFQLTTEQKTVPALLKGTFPAHATKSAGTVDVTIISYEKMDAGKITGALQVINAYIIEDMPMFRSFTIRIAKDKVQQLVGLPFVQWVEFIDAPNQLENTPGRTLHRVNILNDGPRNLKGDGVNVGIWDGGAISPHLDFSPTGRLTQVEASGVSQHSTHCAGTILGRGLINPLARGMAPNANLFSYNFNGNIQTEMATGIPANNLVVSSHSYGSTQTCGLTGAGVSYSATSRATDLNLNNFPFHLHCHSAGNSQSSCTGGWSTITASGKSAKNNILVAAVTSTDAMTTFSSFGPVADGRVKPEIAAFGNGVFSTSTPLNTYATLSGTSMATPGVAGTVSLLVQRYKQLNADALPISSLIKNIVLNGANDMGNAGPDYKFGYGRINALQAVRILEQNRYIVNTVSTGATNTHTISVPAGTSRIKVMLNWNDPAGTANANPALVNNLDLVVANGATTTLPWVLDPNNPATVATRGIDNVSNIEQVTITSPNAGDYQLRVTGTAIPSGPQQYSLTWTIDQPYIEVIYPNGGESFNPGSTEIITWDNVGVTGTQTVEYSLNNGTSWTTISSSVAATTTRLSWAVPAGNTSTALIRITSGTITDVSDANFKILGTTTGFATTASGCSSGTVNFTWNNVTNSTNYDIYRLDATTGNFEILAADITGTTYTASGLTPGASLWFYIVAKNNSTGAVSARSNAINATVSSGGGGLGIVGSISGQVSICGTASNVVYTISPVTGATTYTWTAPPGAVIASGQGTTTININYPAGSTSGNVSVVAGNGVCQTPASTLAITLGSTSITAPLTGGNQTVTLCPANPVPTLTATATVPPGQTIIWYTTATGSITTTNPVLSTVGTITYYAAAFNSIAGCQSATRTAVTLTINATVPASIIAGGPVSFCQGGSVVLTANTGSSYLWSNGATTQSITVSATGNYSVTVTQAGGCTDVSASTVVTVNQLPVADITANGATTFCDGNSVVLTATPGNSWLWSNGASTQSITISTTGNYSVTVTGIGGCTATSSPRSVTVNANPPALINANGTTTYCDGGNVILTASAGNSYLWSNGATTQSITVNASGNFTVAVTQNGGCISNSTTTAVTVNPNPAADISASGATSFCQGNNVILTASAGNSWLWSNGATTQSITVGTTNSYTVTVTNTSGCSASSQATAVSVSPNPQVNITASPYRSLYPGLTTTLTANVTPAGNYIYGWFKNGVAIPAANGSALTGININDLGDYTVSVTNVTGLPCSNSSDILSITDSVTYNLFIFPSPNNGQFNVAYYTTGSNASNTLVIFDAKGARVYSASYSITSPYQLMKVDMRQHGSGVYMVMLYDRNGKKIAKGKVLIQ